MTKTNHLAAVDRAVNLLCTLPPRPEVTDALLEAWTIGLRDMDPDDIATATRKALESCTFMPAPAELRKLVGRLSIEERSAIAWDLVLGNGNPYSSVCFDDPLIHYAVRQIGGWVYLWQTCGQPDREAPHLKSKDQFRKEFRSYYERAMRQTENGELPVGEHHNHLRGLFELENDQRDTPRNIRMIVTKLPPVNSDMAALRDRQRRMLDPNADGIRRLAEWSQA